MFLDMEFKQHWHENSKLVQTKTKKRTGRPRKTTRQDVAILIKSKRNRFITAPEIASEINMSLEQNISETTVRRRLREKDFLVELLSKNLCSDRQIKRSD